MGKFPRKKTMWEYPICMEAYETEQEAQDCVENCIYDEPQEVEKWQCVDCDELYDDKEDAYSCCE